MPEEIIAGSTGIEVPIEPEALPLPLPGLPAGAVQITFQANIGGYGPATTVVAPRMVQKMIRRVNEEGKMIDGVFVPKYSGLVDLFMQHVRSTLFADLEARYPEVSQELSLLEQQLEQLKQRILNQPDFLEA